MGMLVESFWDRGIQACGIDISPYAISQVRPDMQSYCHQGSLSEPSQGQYDLVTCIEVLEHMHEDEARIAAANLTRITDRILFSSTPDDFAEPTHFTVRPVIYWLRLFGELGFWPDLEYDASYVAQHAMLLRRRPEGIPAEALTLFARHLGFRAAIVRQTSELERIKCDKSGMECRIQELAAMRDHLEQAVTLSANRLSSAEIEIEELLGERTRLNADRLELQEGIAGVRAQLDSDKTEILKLKDERACLEDRQSALQGRITLLESERARLHSRMAAADAIHATHMRRLRHESEAEVQWLVNARDRVQAELNAILESPGWRLLAGYRRWFARHLEKGSWVVRMYEPVVRWCLQRAAQTRIPPQLTQTARVASSQVPAPVAQAEDVAAKGETSYERWILENEPTELASQTETARTLLYRPLLSVILPVYRVDPDFLERCVRSVLSQTYDNWELCVADGCPEAHQNRTFLSDVASRDVRIKLLLLDRNGGISGNSNSAIAMAKGEFAVLLDHDDALAPFALYEVVSRLQEDRRLDVVYSDHDHINAASERFGPLFKPDWSPDLMLSANYITHLTVIRRALISEVGGFDPETDGAQDWDLFFKVLERTDRIGHIAKILYHWRVHPASTARNTGNKDYAERAQVHALQGRLERMNLPAKCEMEPSGVPHVRWSPLKGKVSIIIPSKDKVELLSRCINTVIETTTGEDLEIVIVDNGSTETSTTDYYSTLGNEPRIRIVRFDAPFNYSAMNNLGATHAAGDYLLFLNNDVEAISPGWLPELMGWAQVQDVGAVGGKLLRPGGAIQHAGVVVGFGGFAGHPFADLPENTFGLFGSTEWYRNYLAVTGACMAIRRDLFEQIGGFDERFISCGSDVEICLRLRSAGYRIVYNPFVRLIHHECATRQGAVPDSDFFTSFRHYRTFLEQGDPYWNRNLSPWKSSIALYSRGEQASFDFAQDVIARLTAAQSSSGRPSPVRDSSEEERLVSWFDFSEDDVRRSKATCTQVDGYHHVRRLAWFIPNFQNPYYGGICTILRFADYLRQNKNVCSFYVVYGSAEPEQILSQIQAVDPGCSSSDITVMGANDDPAVPESDACVATLWATAFPVLKYQTTKRKFYFIQDYEPLFYRAGSGSGLAQSTYRFGFYGIANTVSLKKSYEKESGKKTIHFSPCVDTEVFFPPSPRFRQLKLARPYRQLFCYARPNHPRNAFELIAAALRTVKERLGDYVRIVCAGDEWRPEEFNLAGIVENLGILDYRRTAQVYRESDAGVALMFTRHPSYIPFELMACGAMVIANRNHWTKWLLKDGENCLLSEASATCLADTIVRGLENDDERTRIVTTAGALIQDNHTDWTKQICRVYDFICDPETCYDQGV
jgi:GT2 family glycosyltransferase/glycosyltransferase involved in cell wall biosynthesis